MVTKSPTGDLWEDMADGAPYHQLPRQGYSNKVTPTSRAMPMQTRGDVMEDRAMLGERLPKMEEPFLGGKVPRGCNGEKGKNHVLTVRADLSSGEYQKLYTDNVASQFVLPNGRLNVVRKCQRPGFFDSRRDRFRTLLEYDDYSLCVHIFFLYVVWANLHGLILALITRFDYQLALGPASTGIYDYYFFVMETMFAIGFGTPRYPACFESNCYVSVIIVSTTILNGIILGVIFAKFTSSASRRFAVKFSDCVCASIITPPAVEDPSVFGAAANSKRFSQLAVHTDLFAPSEFNFSDTTSNVAQQNMTTGSGASDDHEAVRVPDISLQTEDSSVNLLSTALPRTRSPVITPTAGDSAAPQPLSTSAGAARPGNVGDGENESESRAKGRSGSFTSPFLQRGGGSIIGRQISTSFQHAHTSGGRARNHFNLLSSLLGGTSRMRRTSMSGVPEVEAEATVDLLQQQDRPYALSFRVQNITRQQFFDSNMSVYLMHHSPNGLVISEFSTYYTDIPLHFMEMCITVTVDNADLESPLHGISPEDLLQTGAFYELVVLLSFIDNCTASPVEIRSSWRLDALKWGDRFKSIVRRLGPDDRGAYEIDLEGISHTEPSDDSANREFVAEQLKSTD